MKAVALLACLLVGTTFASPVNNYFTFPPPYYSFDLWSVIETLLGQEGYETALKVVELAHKIQQVVTHMKEKVPGMYEEIHELADEILVELKEIVKELEEIFQKKSAYGFNLLDSLSELTGGTKVSTVLRLLSLADKAHRLINDVKKTLPHLEKTLTNIEKELTGSMTDLAHHVLKDLGLKDTKVARSVSSFLEELLNRAKHEIHDKILQFLQAVDDLIFDVEDLLPEVYVKLQKTFEEIREEMKKIMHKLDEMLVGYSFFDTLQDLTSGTRMSTVFEVINLISKVNAVVQDIRGFGPKAELLIEHSVTKVAHSAQDFLTVAYRIMVVPS